MIRFGGWKEAVVLERRLVAVGLVVVVFGGLVLPTGWVGSPSDAKEISLATGNSVAAVASRSSYSADPNGLIAHLDRLRRHSTGLDIWQVWVCELDTSGFSNAVTVNVSTGGIVSKLNRETRPYFRWLSSGLYDPVFVAGGEPVSVVPASMSTEDVIEGCRRAVAAAVEPSAERLIAGTSPARPDGVVIAVNANTVGNTKIENGDTLGWSYGMSSGDACLDASPGTRCNKFPSNNRAIYIAGGRYDDASDGLPLLPAHEIGHTLGFSHSYAVGSGSMYDNPMDVISDAFRHQGKEKVGTIAVNRYQAGWISNSGVEVHKSGTAVYALRPPGTSQERSLRPAGGLPEMLALPGSRGVFIALGAREASGFDEQLTEVPRQGGSKGKEGVEAYLIDQRTSACNVMSRGNHGVCMALLRRTRQVRPTGSTGATSHVYVKNGSFRTNSLSSTGIPDFTVTMADKIGDSWLVRVSPGNRSTVMFSDIRGNAHQYSIELLKTMGVSNGCSTGNRYCPRSFTTRAQMAMFLVRAMGEEPISKTAIRTTRFSDVPRSHWAWGYVEKLVDLGITIGVYQTVLLCH